MICVGVDVGSLTAKAVVLRDGQIAARALEQVRATARTSAEAVVDAALRACGCEAAAVSCCCATGYGRLEIPLAQHNRTEIACHAIGATWCDSSIRTLIDIGGQDCKVIATDDAGHIESFVMNDKCAAGTGRSLELLAATLGVSLEQLGTLSLRSRKELTLGNRCSIFMELDVLEHLYARRRVPDIARAINLAVAKRVVTLARPVAMREQVVITGGVAKNPGVVAELGRLLGVSFATLGEDPQLIGAIGAAVMAQRLARKAAA